MISSSKQIKYEAYKQRFRDELASLPPCPKDHIRLYRAELDGVDEHRKATTTSGEPYKNRYASMSLHTTLKYFGRYFDDFTPPKDAYLTYLDVTIDEARTHNTFNMSERRRPSDPQVTGNYENFILTDEMLAKRKAFFRIPASELPDLLVTAPMIFGNEIGEEFPASRCGEVIIHSSQSLLSRLNEERAAAKRSSQVDSPTKKR